MESEELTTPKEQSWFLKQSVLHCKVQDKIYCILSIIISTYFKKFKIVPKCFKSRVHVTNKKGPIK